MTEVLCRLMYGFFFLQLVFLGGCAGTESIRTGKIFAEPQYELSAVRFIDVDMQKLRMEVDLVVTNPNYLSLEFRNIHYQMQVDGTPVLSGKMQDPVVVPARGDFEVTIPLELELNNLADGALSVMLKRKLEYLFEARMNSAIPILEKRTFTVTKTEVLEF